MKSSAIIAAAVLLSASSAQAGGLARPNPISARSVGMGGAFSAIADDPTALHFNPAGLALTRKSHIMIGGEFVVAPRTYDPDFDTCDTSPDQPLCQQDQSPTSPVRPLPSLGFSTRLKQEGAPSRLAFGIGFWNSFGGQLEYPDDDPPIPGTLIETQNAVLEVVPGIAYEVNDVLAIGAAFRLGIGLFKSKAIQRPNDAEMSARGVGAGGTLGVLVTPGDALRLAAYYRTALTVTTTGDGVIQQATPLEVQVEFQQRWPQQAGFAAAYRPIDKLMLAGQIDWFGWSRVNVISPVFKGEPSLTRQAAIPTDWDNNIQLHAGVQYDVSGALQLRGGYTFDTTAVTPRLRERQFLDGDSMFFAIGGSYYINKSLRIDTAYEMSPKGTSVIEDNTSEVAAWSQRANASPGKHTGQLFTFELAVQYLY